MKTQSDLILDALKFGGQVNSASQSDRNTSISKGKALDPDKDSRKLGHVAPKAVSMKFRFRWLDGKKEENI